VNLGDVRSDPADIASPLDIVRPPTLSVGLDLYGKIIKRAIDLAVALIALILLWPALILVALLIRLDSPGPALFVQRRIGKGGRPFNILKFRTMSHSVDDSAHHRFMQAFVRGDIAGLSSFASRRRSSRSETSRSAAVYKPFAESRVTRVGRVLRKTSLDELPQLVNVLKGQMSLIGPRPNVPWEVEAYKNWHRERLNVLPGITGLAQVRGRSAISFDTIARYDIEYVRRLSLALDLQIAIKTVSSVISGKGAS
jgi:lipopolysaccharide/colanic/teichoic acid biosynthesis glycosyltransferase